MTKSNLFSGMVILGALALFGCGGDDKAAPAPPDPTSSSSSSSSGSSGSTGFTTSSSSSSTTGTLPSTGIHILTGVCLPPGGCPTNEQPYRVFLKIEFHRVNGWITIGQADTGSLGEITLDVGANPGPGDYRVSAVSPQPAGITPPATAPAQTVTVSAGTISDVIMHFTP